MMNKNILSYKVAFSRKAMIIPGALNTNGAETRIPTSPTPKSDNDQRMRTSLKTTILLAPDINLKYFFWKGRRLKYKVVTSQK